MRGGCRRKLYAQVELSSVMRDERRLSAVGVNAEAAARVWRQFLEKPRAVGWSRPWAIYVLVKWCEVNGIS